MALKFAELVYDGMWYTPLREALSAFVDSTQQSVNGTARLKLYKGNCIPAGVKSPNSLYMEEILQPLATAMICTATRTAKASSICLVCP